MLRNRQGKLLRKDREMLLTRKIVKASAETWEILGKVSWKVRKAWGKCLGKCWDKGNVKER